MMLSLDNLNDLLTALTLLPSGDYTAKLTVGEDVEREKKRITLSITGAITTIRIVRYADYDNS